MKRLPGGSRAPGAMLATYLVVLAALPGEATAQSDGEPPGESLAVRVVQSERWVVTGSTTVRVELTSSYSDEIFVDSIRWALPEDLVCGEQRSNSVTRPLTGMVGIRDGETYGFPVDIPGLGGCLPSGILRPAKAPLSVTVWYAVPGEGERTSSHESTLTWAAPMGVVMLGALLGVLAAYLLLFLAVKSGRLPALPRAGPIWAELCFAVLSIAVIVGLLRLLEPHDQPEWLRRFVAESLGHGMYLGLVYDLASRPLLRMIGGKKMPQDEDDGDGEDRDAPEPQPPSELNTLLDRSAL